MGFTLWVLCITIKSSLLDDQSLKDKVNGKQHHQRYASLVLKTAMLTVKRNANQ